jgi:hypothetical protein
MDMNAAISCEGELSATVIRRDGSIEELGVISSRKWRLAAVPKAQYGRHQKIAAMILGIVIAGLAYLLGWLIRALFFSLLVIGIVTTAGVNYMATDFASGGVTPTISGFKFHDSGTGTNAAATTDTALQTPSGTARTSGTASNPSANIYRSVATISYTSTLAITEWGIFSAAAAGTLWDRRVFSAINVVSGDSIQFTYNLTVNAGGT